jgi:hypothetical protein
MESFEIQPVLDSALSDVARFLHSWPGDDDRGSAVERPVSDDSLRIEKRLRWLLVENPFTSAASQYGFCIRNASGGIMGLLLAFPGEFRVADQRLLALCSGSFFVKPQARTQGLYLFKRYLNSPGYSFFFATTCNANSGALWRTLGGCAVPNSERVYRFPLRLEVLLPASVTGRTSSRLAADMARLVGRGADPVLKLLRRRANLTIEPCRDWDKLAALSRRHRCAHLITTDRSAAFLRWRYGPGSPNHPYDVWLFRDTRGNEGWFSLDTIRSGRQGEIRGCVVLDAVWPREAMSFRDILPAMLQLVAPKADALFFQPRPGLDYRESSRWIFPYRLEAPQIFAMARKGGAPLAVSSLDLVPADGDYNVLA